jgi:hypothetical protein
LSSRMTRRLVPALQVTLGVVDCCGHQYPIVLRVASLERVVVGYRKSFWLLVSVAELVAEQYGVTEGGAYLKSASCSASR